MSDNKKQPNIGEPISEEQLDAVSGGYESSAYPIASATCWFEAAGGELGDGRTQCKRECKGKFNTKEGSALLVPCEAYESGDWLICRCWGTDHCIDRKHKPCGHTNRWGSK